MKLWDNRSCCYEKNSDGPLMNSVTSSLVLFLSLIVSWPVFAQDDCSATSIVLPLRISTEILEDMLNRDIPRQMRGHEDINISGVKGERVEWSMRRSPINLAAGNNRLNANTTISGKVRVRGKVRPWGPNFSVGPDLKIGANLSIRPMLTNDWRLAPNAEASARVTSARINTPVGSISVRTQSQKAVNKLLRRTVDPINEKFGRDQSLRREGQKLWEDLHRIEKLSDEPPIWLVMRPTQIGATNLTINNDGVDFRIFAAAETNIRFGDEPRLTREELPQLQLLDEPPEGKIELALPIFSDWETLNGLIVDSLAKNPVVHEGNSARLTLTSIRLAPGPEESVMVSATIPVEPTGWTGRMLHRIQDGLQAVGLTVSLIEVWDNQIVEMSVKPILSEEGRIALESVKLVPSSSNLVKTLAATYSWLTDETIEDVIERHAVADLSALLEEVEKDAQVRVNEFTREIGESGFSLSVKIQPVTRFSSVSVLPGGLIAKVCAAADIEAEIRSLDF